MYNPRFEKARFKKDVQDNVKRLFRKELDEANPQEQFQADQESKKLSDVCGVNKIYQQVQRGSEIIGKKS